MNGNARSIRLRMGFVLAILFATLLPAGLNAQDGAQGQADFSPGSGPPGTEVHVTVSGWPSGRLTLLGDGEPLCTIRTGNNGRGECTFTVPEDEDGRLHLTMTGENVSRSEIGVFHVTGGGGGDDERGGGRNGSDGSRDPGARLLDRLGIPPAQEFGEESDAYRRAALCLLGTLDPSAPSESLSEKGHERSSRLSMR